jgi:hypothetical protein
LSIADCRYAKHETRNSKIAFNGWQHHPFRVSNFDFRIPIFSSHNRQSAIDNELPVFGGRLRIDREGGGCAASSIAIHQSSIDSENQLGQPTDVEQTRIEPSFKSA